jgi:helicase
MNLADLSGLPQPLMQALSASGIAELRPCQEKAIAAGLLDGKSLLVCTPTASGKTLVGEMAAMKAILEGKGKAVYLVPLVALANEKYKEFKQKYGSFCKVALSIGDYDSSDPHLANYDLLLLTVEKMDSLLRHQAPWLSFVKVVVVDEVHLLNDSSRGPTLEVLLTLLKKLLPGLQLVALSATIGNAFELANWLKAELVIDSWRPVPLHKGVYYEGKIEF